MIRGGDGGGTKSQRVQVNQSRELTTASLVREDLALTSFLCSIFFIGSLIHSLFLYSHF